VRRVRSNLPGQGLVGGELLTPGADGDVRLLATDRDVGVGRIRDPQQQVLELALDVSQLPFGGLYALACLPRGTT
jgi:hypothetical protein